MNTAMFTKPSFVFDMICVVVLLVLALHYARKGLVATLMQMAGTILSVFGARYASNHLASWIFENFLAQSFVEKISATIQTSGSVDLAAIADKFAGFLPESFRTSIVETFAGSVDQALSSNAAQMADGIVTNVIEPLFTPVISIILFFVTFALCRMVVSLIVTVLANVNRIPVIGTVNQWLGFAVGLVNGAVDLFLMLCIVWALIVITGGGLPYLNDAALASSWFYRLFNSINPFI